jgi:subtilisin family serine protease
MQIIVDFINSAEESDIILYLQSNNCTVIKTFSLLDKCYLVVSDILPPKTAIVESVVEDSVGIVNLLATSEIITSNNDEWWKLASFTKPNFSGGSQSFNRNGSQATVYIVDSGIKIVHPDFIDANITNLFSFNGNFVDTNGHGTALASVIAGKICGVTSANIKSVKIFQSGVTTLQSDILSALNAIIQDRIDNPAGYPVVNMSWAIPKNSLIETKIQLMIDAGLTVVCAAGNSGIAIENVTPASMDTVVTVGAYGPNFKPCNFSNYTSAISNTPSEVNSGALDVWAPGANIYVALLDNTFGHVSGTSVSSAIHSASMAFNSDSLMLEGGDYPLVVSLEHVLHPSTGKQGLLVLEGVYTDSVNLVTVLRETNMTSENTVYSSIASSVDIVTYSGVYLIKNIVPTYTGATLNLTSQLPDGLTYFNGWISGTVGNIADMNSSILSLSGIFTNSAGISKPITIRIAILPSGQDISNLPADDPAIAITLLACGAIAGPGANFHCGGTGCPNTWICHDACGVTKAPSPAGLQCECDPTIQCQ